MNYSETHSELFDHYLRGELPAGDRVAFEKKLAEDKEFAEAFNIHRIIAEGIRDHGKQEMKAYLKEHGKVHLSGEKNIVTRKLFYAAAAVIVLFVGVYSVVHFYIQPAQSTDLAMKQEQEESLTDSLSGKVLPENVAREMPAKKKNEESLMLQSERLEETYRTPPGEVYEDLATAEVPREAEVEDYKSLDNAGRKDMDFKIAVEKKLKDTMMYLPILAAVFTDDADKFEVSSVSKNVNAISTENKISRKSKAKIPSNADNNAGAGTGDGYGKKEKANADSVSYSFAKPAEKSADLEKEAPKKPMKIEFWQSPVNFKGYKYEGHIIQLYGLTNYLVKLYVVNNIIYMEMDGDVFVLDPCPDACPFKTETNTEIRNYILKQN